MLSPIDDSYWEKLLVYVYKRPFLRDKNLEYERFFGRKVLEDLFDNEKENDTESIFLSFPEQWLNIVELRSLHNRIVRFCPNIKEVVIKTHSVYIIQCTMATSCRIIETNCDSLQESDTGKLYVPNIGNIFNMKKLNVI